MKVELMRKFTLGLALLLAAVVPTSAVAADDGPVARERVTVSTGLVRLGDLFDKAGEKAGVAVFRSPDLGTTGMVSAARVRAAAANHGLVWNNPKGLTKFTVVRESKLVTVDVIADRIKAHLSERLTIANGTDLSVEIAANSKPIHLQPDGSEEIEISGVETRRSSGGFRAIISVRAGQSVRRRIAYRGKFLETVEMPVLATGMARGQIIRKGDVLMARVPRRKLTGKFATGTGQLIGMAVKRRLRAGKPVRPTDIERPKLVAKSMLVTIVFKMPGLSITARGRALDAGARGEVINVVNTQSRRIIQAIVVNHGQVVPAKQAGALRVAGR